MRKGTKRERGKKKDSLVKKKGGKLSTEEREEMKKVRGKRKERRGEKKEGR